MNNKMPEYLTGLGIDYHPIIKKESDITLATIKFSSDFEIVAHSDGDLILHAIADGILGALGLNDIGHYFSDNDADTLGLDSLEILRFALNKLDEYNYYINNVDLTLISNHIMISNKVNKIKEELRRLLDCYFINIKATRHELKDFYRIDCFCQILLKRK